MDRDRLDLYVGTARKDIEDIDLKERQATGAALPDRGLIEQMRYVRVLLEDALLTDTRGATALGIVRMEQIIDRTGRAVFDLRAALQGGDVDRALLFLGAFDAK